MFAASGFGPFAGDTAPMVPPETPAVRRLRPGIPQERPHLDKQQGAGLYVLQNRAAGTGRLGTMQNDITYSWKSSRVIVNADLKTSWGEIEAMNPEEIKFTKEHEWVKVEGKRAIIGITDYAQDELGDIVYIELPEVGEEVSSMEEITEIESTKTTAPVMSPVSGRIIEVNEELKDAPELINEDPYGKGWIAVLDMSDPAEVEDLMDSKEYDEYLEQETE